MRKIDFIAAAILSAIVCVIVAIAFFFSSASACSASVGRADTDCYVRRIDDKTIVGSLAKGDMVVVDGSKNGWYRINVNGDHYMVWGEYMTVSDGICLDEVNVKGKVRKSRSASQTIRNAQECSISGSDFDGIGFW